MAWQTPKTDWANGNRFTYSDMNRITGNINTLYPAANLKDDWAQNDILTVTAWSSVLNALQALIVTSGLSASIPGDAMTGDTMNEVEDLTQRLSDRIELNLAQEVANIYSGDDLFSAAPVENYTRGI